MSKASPIRFISKIDVSWTYSTFYRSAINRNRIPALLNTLYTQLNPPISPTMPLNCW